jgi:hypothetical protein
MAQDQVTARLVIKFVADLLECSSKHLPRNTGKFAQMLTSTNSSSIDGGMGSPCFLRLSR